MSALAVLQCSPEEHIKILSFHGKTINQVQEDVNTITEWLQKQLHLPEVPEGRVIERFLVMNKFRLENVKRKLDAYYTARTLIPEFFNKNPNESELQKIMNVVYYIPLPKLTKELNRAVIIKVKDTNVDNFDVVSYIALTLSSAEIRLKEDMHFKEIHIYDLEGIKMGHVAKFTPAIIKKIAFVLEKVYANVSAGVHFINAPIFVDSFISVVRTMLKTKLANRLFVHRGVESLHEMIPKECLPKDYGGYERSLEELTDEWRVLFSEYEDLFQYLHTLKVKEDLRPEKLVIDDYFGVYGNFKQLEVD